MPKKIRLSFTKENRALVRAGLKTETRRKLDLPSSPNGLGQEVEGIAIGSVTGIVESLLGTPGIWDVQFWLDNPATIKSPYGNPQAEPVTYWMPEPVQLLDMGGKALPWVEVRYLDDGEDSVPQYCEVPWETFTKILERKERYAAKGRDWREPINPRFMYRELARTWLPGFRVWPERLGEMSILSAICEGISEQDNLNNNLLPQ